MTILDMLQRAGSRNATGCAVASGPRRFSFADLEGGSNAAARVLRAHGVRKGDRVALVAGKDLEWILAYLGAQKLGAIALPINPAYRERELQHILGDATPRVMVVDATTRDAVRAAAPEPVGAFVETGVVDPAALPRQVHPFYQAVRKASVHPVDELVFDRDDALLLYTSGTTGRPKGAVLTHGNLAANARAMVEAFAWTASDRLLHALPLFHVHGLCVALHGSILAGGETILLPRFDPAAVLAALRDQRATMFMGVPTMYARLLEASPEAGVALPAMRLFVSGSAPLPAALLDRFRARFGHEILERYGMTETLITLCQPIDGPRTAGTVGVPVDGVEARICRPDGAPAADDEEGELQVRGACVGPRYWNDEASTRESRVDGWFRTGDVAVRAADGVFRIAGRARELILSGGYNVYPREVEDALAEHPAVREACVFGVPDEDLGEAVVAAVVLRDGAGATADELVAHCRERLASYKKPREVRFVAELPRNAMGKVVRGELSRG